MYQATVPINGVPTEVISYGRWIEEGISTTGRQDVVIVITGNPGVPSFYKEFAAQIQKSLPTEVPVWIIGHTGHTKPPSHLPNSLPDPKTCRHLYDLDGNIKHKQEFIKKYVPANARIHLVAHSIGSWFVLNLLKDKEISEKIVKCYLLFPTIERMAESPMGKIVINITLRIAKLLMFLAWIFTLFPHIFQIFLVRIFGIFYGIPSNCVSPIVQMIHPFSLHQIFSLAKQEMIHVKELDNDVITQHKKKLYLYYGSKDGWTPIRYYDDLKARHPDIDAHLCKRGFQHSFVLSDSIEMGKMVGDLINESISSGSN
ncbi:hypothetical protein TKK_0002452 [Trichogramma kaykai]|uniref:Lipid droplet-associated hydrolase n=1 Tax=Trichogramma kaykai TaxID=54128 RepID=A0ABD2VX62_9HYME